MYQQINGSLRGVKSERFRQLRKQLEPLGYEFSNDYSFNKEGTIEAAINELVPVCEELGWDAEKDLHLTETNLDGAHESKFENGRVLRKFPRGV